MTPTGPEQTARDSVAFPSGAMTERWRGLGEEGAVLEPIVTGLFWLLVGYLGVGVLVAIALHARGLAAMDPTVRGAAFGFRILVTPGLVALWPLLLHRWKQVTGEEGAPLPDPDRPLTPVGLRKTQRRISRLAWIVAGVGAFCAIVERPPRLTVPPPILASDAATPAGAAWTPATKPFPDLPIETRLLGAPTGPAQIELAVAEDLGIATLALYFCPPGSRSDDAPGASARFLGTIWGPKTLHFDLPTPILEAIAAGSGEWVLYSVARAETIAVAPVSSAKGETP